MNLVTLTTPIEYRGQLVKPGEKVQLDDQRYTLYKGEGLVKDEYDHALVRRSGKLKVMKASQLVKDGIESQDIIQRLTAEEAEAFKGGK